MSISPARTERPTSKRNYFTLHQIAMAELARDLKEASTEFFREPLYFSTRSICPFLRITLQELKGFRNSPVSLNIGSVGSLFLDN